MEKTLTLQIIDKKLIQYIRCNNDMKRNKIHKVFMNQKELAQFYRIDELPKDYKQPNLSNQSVKEHTKHSKIKLKSKQPIKKQLIKQSNNKENNTKGSHKALIDKQKEINKKLQLSKDSTIYGIAKLLSEQKARQNDQQNSIQKNNSLKKNAKQIQNNDLNGKAGKAAQGNWKGKPEKSFQIKKQKNRQMDNFPQIQWSHNSGMNTQPLLSKIMSSKKNHNSRLKTDLNSIIVEDLINAMYNRQHKNDQQNFQVN